MAAAIPRSSTGARRAMQRLQEQVNQLSISLDQLRESLPASPSPKTESDEPFPFPHMVAPLVAPLAPQLHMPRPTTLRVVYDFETTGIGKTKDIHVTQVGAQCLDDDFQPTSTFTRFVNPKTPISAGATKVSGITDADVSGLPSWDTVGKDFAQWIATEMRGAGASNVTLVAHNGKVYDARILVFENARHHIPTPSEWHHCDSIPVFKAMFPAETTYSLGKLYASVFGAPFANAHTADADCAAIASLLQRDADWARELITSNRESFSAVGKRCFKV